MARKVFMSVLGTGFYNKCRYGIGDFVSDETRFIQQATLKMLTQRETWTENDCAFILVTDKAHTDNWQVAGDKRCRPRSAEADEYIGLEKTLHNDNYPFPIEEVTIKDGSNEAEIWEIFSAVYEKLQDNDELYFDLTHGFRYLPMLVLVLGNYAKFLKNVKVKNITYGNFEATDRQTNTAPIIDVTSFSSLQDWTSAVASYLKHGDATLLNACGKSELTPILKETKGQDVVAKNMRNLCDALQNFTDSLRFCRGMSVYEGKDVSKVLDCLDKVDDTYLKPMLPLLGRIGDSLKRFGEPNTNMLAAAELCKEFNNWQAAATFLEEGVTTYFCLRHGIKVDDDSKRDVINKTFQKKLKLLNDDMARYKPFGNAKDEIVDNVITDALLVRGLVNDVTNLIDIRNDINHAGMRKTRAPQKIINIKKNIEKTIDCLNLDDAQNAFKQKEKQSSVFINLSNHPSENWGAEQRQAAEAIGTIIDMQFPAVEPEATAEAINKEADRLVAEIMKYAVDNLVTVHVMGEMSLTYAVVNKLSAYGVRCVCSTTNRVVREEGDGKRMVEFHFKQFRDYV